VNNIFIVKAFANEPFKGNPAAVCVLEELLPDSQLQRIATELNQPISSFIVPRADGCYDLRYFGPKNRVEICGHGTVAAAHVVVKYLNHAATDIQFDLGRLTLHVGIKTEGFEIEMPLFGYKPIVEVLSVTKFLGVRAQHFYKSFYDVIAEFPNEQAVRALKPDFSVALASSIRALLVSAPGIDSDYCYRVFAPSVGVNEDHFCGSANAALGPFWSHKLGRSRLLGNSVSQRGGLVPCEVNGKSVKICGQALTWFVGNIKLDACA